MTIEADLHTHTIFSHGKQTPEQMVQSAIKKGLKKIAITDHAPSHIFYGVRNMPRYLDAIHRAQDKYSDKIMVLAGLEFNIVSLSGQLEADEKLLDKLDIVLFGFHKAVLYRDFKSAQHFYLRRYAKDSIEKNTQSIINAIDRNSIDILVHPGHAIPVAHAALAAACAKRNTAVELNASHPDLAKEDFFTYERAGVLFVVSSDAHSRQKVGVFGTMPEMLAQAGVEDARVINAAK
jgi:putative hydrolase